MVEVADVAPVAVAGLGEVAVVAGNIAANGVEQVGDGVGGVVVLLGNVVGLVHFSFSKIVMLIDMILGGATKPRLNSMSFQCHIDVFR